MLNIFFLEGIGPDFSLKYDIKFWSLLNMSNFQKRAGVSPSLAEPTEIHITKNFKDLKQTSCMEIASRNKPADMFFFRGMSFCLMNPRVFGWTVFFYLALVELRIQPNLCSFTASPQRGLFQGFWAPLKLCKVGWGWRMERCFLISPAAGSFFWLLGRDWKKRGWVNLEAVSSQIDERFFWGGI